MDASGRNHYGNHGHTSKGSFGQKDAAAEPRSDKRLSKRQELERIKRLREKQQREREEAAKQRIEEARRRDAEEHAREASRLRQSEKKKAGLAERLLQPYDPAEREFIRGKMYDGDFEEAIDSEIEKHPERYADIPSYANVRRKVVALSNIYRHSDEDALMDEAHLFVFDDAVWLDALNCEEPLTHLPYPVCLVEDVLLYSMGDEIRARTLSGDADAGQSRRLMSYVEHFCRRVDDDDNITFQVASDEGNIAGHALANWTSADRRHVHAVTLDTTSSQESRLKGTHASPLVHHRRGFWRNQACGPGMKLHKRIWISSTIVRPSTGKPYKVSDQGRIHRVTYSG